MPAIPQEPILLSFQSHKDPAGVCLCVDVVTGKEVIGEANRLAELTAISEFEDSSEPDQDETINFKTMKRDHMRPPTLVL